MFAGMMAALKALSLAQKVAIPVAIVLVLVGSYWTWKWKVQSAERQKVNLENAVELQKQGQDATVEYTKQSDSKDLHVEEVIAINAQLTAQVNALQKENDRYAKKKSCALDDDAVQLVNRARRVLRDATEKRVPTSGETAGSPAVETATAVAVTDTSALTQRITELTDREARVEILHKQLSEYSVEQYCSAYRYHYGVEDPECGGQHE